MDRVQTLAFRSKGQLLSLRHRKRSSSSRRTCFLSSPERKVISERESGMLSGPSHSWAEKEGPVRYFRGSPSKRGRISSSL